MNVRSLLAAAAAVMSLCVPAVAADMPTKAPVYVVPATNWTGGYIGAFAGYHYGEVTQSGCVGACSPGEPIRTGLFGVQFGYDWQMPNNWVWGAFAFVPLVPERETVLANPGAIPFETRTNFQAILAARLGYAMGNMLPYVFAGPGLVHNKIVGPFGSDSAWHTTAAVGVGLEYRLAANWSVDLKYAYAAILKATYDVGGGPEKMGDNSSNFIAAINYRFEPGSRQGHPMSAQAFADSRPDPRTFDFESSACQAARPRPLDNVQHGYAALASDAFASAKAQSSHGVSASTSPRSTVQPHQMRKLGGASR
jgi:outer membrane immunogenic protein